MNPDQTEMLIRVDQNVLNLVKTFEKHIIDDKEFQDSTTVQLQSLNTDRDERRGATRFAGAAYGVLGGIVGTLVSIFYHKWGS